MYHCGMRQMEEKHVANQVDLMVWSNRLDLLAISNFKGEVQVHRLHWQKVWNFPAPKENVTVRAMAWRPDGKALAIGYSSGSVYVLDIEDKEILEKYDLEPEMSEEFEDIKHYGITCITWVSRAGTLESTTDSNIYEDTSIYLQKLPDLTAGFKGTPSDDSIKDFKQVQEPTHLNMFIVGYGTGSIYMSVFGKFHFGTIHLDQVVKDVCGEFKIIDITLSDDFSMMQVLYVERLTNNVFVSLINTSILSTYAEEIFTVSKRHGHIMQLISYLDQTMTSVTEAWEHILLEMDTKMSYYAASVPEGGVSADLLELLMLGVPSDELELFLLQDLTAKGLKKFGSSVEISYSTIQKLVLRQLNIVSHSLTYYLAELRGLTRIPDRYEILSLEETTVSEAIRASCAFLNKCLELQQVIDQSMRNYKAFFRWLFVVIVRLLDEQTPSEIVKITQQDQSHIADFLYNFDSVHRENSEGSSEKPVKFNLERLGQYLQDQDLTILPDNEDNLWNKFLKDNPCFLKDSETVFSTTDFKKFSLVQQQNFLKKAIHKVFDVTQKDVGKYFSVVHNRRCYEDKVAGNSDDFLRASQIYDGTQQLFLTAFTSSTNRNDGICFMSVDIKESCNAKAIKYYFSSSLIQYNDLNKEQLTEEHLAVIDLQFYSSDYLSVLVSHPERKDSSIFVQLPLKIAVDNATDINIKSKACVFTDKISRRNISPLLDQGVYKILDKMEGLRIAVSGGRKVAVVLSKSHRKVRVFEMEVDGEDEEEEETLELDTTPQDLNTSDDKKSTNDDS